MRKRKYSEVDIPVIPAVLIEMFSHQNVADMRSGLDPGFQFTVGRSIYKGILKYVAGRYGYDYVVQPLPVESFCINHSDSNKIRLSWQPVSDPQELSAVPAGYLIYTRVDDGDFDNGTPVVGVSIETGIENDKIYGFKVTAVNAGGESFPSEVLTVCRKTKNTNNALIVNCFDSVLAPTGIHSNDSVGFVDFGMPYETASYFTGRQYDFDPESVWVDTNCPGLGASNRDLGGSSITGNTFDYTPVLGKTVVDSGFSYTSCSMKAFVNGRIDMEKQNRIYLILGRKIKVQRLTPDRLNVLPAEVKIALEKCYRQGCEIYIGMNEL